MSPSTVSRLREPEGCTLLLCRSLQCRHHALDGLAIANSLLQHEFRHHPQLWSLLLLLLCLQLSSSCSQLHRHLSLSCHSLVATSSTLGHTLTHVRQQSPCSATLSVHSTTNPRSPSSPSQLPLYASPIVQLLSSSTLLTASRPQHHPWRLQQLQPLFLQVHSQQPCHCPSQLAGQSLFGLQCPHANLSTC